MFRFQTPFNFQSNTLNSFSEEAAILSFNPINPIKAGLFFAFYVRGGGGGGGVGGGGGGGGGGSIRPDTLAANNF